MAGRSTRAVARGAEDSFVTSEGGARAVPLALAGADMHTEVLFKSCYTELRVLADGYFRQRSRESTLQPTALVHEVYVRLAGGPGISFKSRQHFLAVAAVAMRQILVDRERRRRAGKRGGGATRITITQDIAPEPRPDREVIVDILALDTALNALATLSPRQARIVEMLSFGGLTVDEAAEVLDVSLSLAEKEWRRARAWLRRELAEAFT